MDKSFDAFISYSRKDEAIANQIASDLETSGISVWKDNLEIVAGERIREGIEAGIRNSKVFVLLASKRSLKSRWVLNELDAAMLAEISDRVNFVLPILIGQIDADMLPADIVGKCFIDLRYNYNQKYEVNRTVIANTVRSLASQRADCKIGKRKLPLVPDFLNRILAHRYDGSREKTDHVKKRVPQLADTLFNDVIDKIHEDQLSGNTPTIFEAFESNVIECRDLFLEKYGAFGARQLILFLIDDVGLSFSRGFTSDDFMRLLGLVNMFLFIYALREHLITDDKHKLSKERLDIDIKTMDDSKIEFEFVTAKDSLGAPDKTST
jgi:TIR domain-containing protein